jgi:hypothetical protein
MYYVYLHIRLINKGVSTIHYQIGKHFEYIHHGKI